MDRETHGPGHRRISARTLDHWRTRGGGTPDPKLT